MENRKVKDKCSLPTEEQRQILFEWLLKHCLNSYPTKTEKKQLMNKTGLTKEQLNARFKNDRIRLGMTGSHVNNSIEEYQKNAANNSPSISHPISSHQIKPLNKSLSSDHKFTISNEVKVEKKESNEKKNIPKNDLFSQINLVVNEVLGSNASEQQINNLYESIQPILADQIEFHVNESSEMACQSTIHESNANGATTICLQLNYCKKLI